MVGVTEGDSMAAQSQARESIESVVRHLVRQRGIDPQQDATGLDRLISEAIAEYEGQSIAGRADPIESIEPLKLELRDAVGGYGPLQSLLDDPTIEEIWIDEPSRVG